MADVHSVTHRLHRENLTEEKKQTCIIDEYKIESVVRQPVDIKRVRQQTKEINANKINPTQTIRSGCE